MRCRLCNSPVSKIGDGVFYCNDCDKIIIDKNELSLFDVKRVKKEEIKPKN